MSKILPFGCSNFKTCGMPHNAMSIHSHVMSSHDHSSDMFPWSCRPHGFLFHLPAVSIIQKLLTPFPFKIQLSQNYLHTIFALKKTSHLPRRPHEQHHCASHTDVSSLKQLWRGFTRFEGSLKISQDFDTDSQSPVRFNFFPNYSHLNSSCQYCFSNCCDVYGLGHDICFQSFMCLLLFCLYCRSVFGSYIGCILQKKNNGSSLYWYGLCREAEKGNFCWERAQSKGLYHVRF